MYLRHTSLGPELMCVAVLTVSVVRFTLMMECYVKEK